MSDLHAKALSGTSSVLDRLKSRLLTIAQSDGDYVTAIPAISVHRYSHATDDIPCVYDFGLAITVSGHKQVVAGNMIFNYSAGQALFASIDLPVVSKVIEASNEEPYIGIMLRLDPKLLMQVAAGMSLPQPARGHRNAALTHGVLEDSLLRSVERLVALLEEPELLDVVAPLVIQEVMARLLASELGPHYLQLNANGSPQKNIAECMIWLKQHFDQAIHIDALAERAHMSPSTFRQHFKSVSGLSPLQYLKQLRLQEARQLMLNEGLDAGVAGLQVGYDSVSQFTREYARLFGQPPSRDIKQLRENKLKAS